MTRPPTPQQEFARLAKEIRALQRQQEEARGSSSGRGWFESYIDAEIAIHHSAAARLTTEARQRGETWPDEEV